MLCGLSAAADRSIRLCEKKKEKGSPQFCGAGCKDAKPAFRRQAAKASGSNTERTIISLRLCENKKRLARKAAKPPRPPEVIPSGPQFLCDLSADRQALRLCESLIIPSHAPRRTGQAPAPCKSLSRCISGGSCPNYNFAPCPPRQTGGLSAGRSPWNK